MVAILPFLRYDADMKALSVKEPWASLIVFGGKNIENRTWRTNYRGPLLICASAQPKKSTSRHAIGIVDVVDCVKQHRSKWFEGPFGWVLANARPIEPMPVKGRLGLFTVSLKEQAVGTPSN
jgi:hypothetical protein